MYRNVGLGLVLWILLSGCGELDEPHGLSGGYDDGGAYTVSASERFTLGASGAGELSVQALSAPSLKLELRNYSAVSTGARSRGVVSLAWPSSDTPLGGTVRVALETVDGTPLASYGAATATGAATFATPYLHQPDVRMCVSLNAELQADSPGGDRVALRLEQRVCEVEAQVTPQDTVLASRTLESPTLRTTAELRFLEGVGHRALLRYEATESTNVSGKLCLHEEGKATCKRSSTVGASFNDGGVAEFVTSYHGSLSGLSLCAGVPGVGACESGGVELLKHHSFDGGVNTNVVLLETLEGVVARATFSVPEGVSLHDYAYLEYIHGGDYESFFSLRAGDRAWKSVPSLSGPAQQTVELGVRCPWEPTTSVTAWGCPIRAPASTRS